ncbi:unnamed protein product [Linum tenue]|uniref:S-protein homolog n=3 Tax=Linum tenue TaxID=586396 RepID=A0AAV0GYN4_9ROSI|nr:unnamed protein product [Linum tenue]
MKRGRAVLIVKVIFVVCTAIMNDVATAKADHADRILPLKKKMTVINGLEGNLQLTVHCKSKDDDLGVRVLGPGQSFYFKFWTCVFASTLFHCSFEWPGSGGIHRFDIYDDRHDYLDCAYCERLVKPFGVCKYTGRTKKFDRCFHWKNESM